MIESERIVWELQHGGPIDAEKLRPCGAAPYASSAYEVSLMTANQPLRSEAVGRYQVFLCDRSGEAKVHVVVPVEPYLLSATPQAQLDQIGAVAMRIEQGFEPLISAERAVRIAAGRSGRRVAGGSDR